MSPADRAGPVVGLTGARFGGSRRRRAAQARAAEAVESWAAGAEEMRAAEDGSLPPSPADAQRAADEAWRIGGVRVRPYVRTGGRTRPAVELAVEALVSTAPGASEPTGADHRAVAALCASPRSVAEVAALLAVPLGVARVLVGDLAKEGVVVVHRTSGPDGPDAALMQRVLDGLRKL
jgi:hypothetical protein